MFDPQQPKTVPTTSQSSTPPQPPLTTQPTAAPTTAESSTAPTDIQKTPKFSPGFYEVAAAFLGRKRNIAFSQVNQKKAFLPKARTKSLVQSNPLSRSLIHHVNKQPCHSLCNVILLSNLSCQLKLRIESGNG